MQMWALNNENVFVCIEYILYVKFVSQVKTRNTRNDHS